MGSEAAAGGSRGVVPPDGDGEAAAGGSRGVVPPDGDGDAAAGGTRGVVPPDGDGEAAAGGTRGAVPPDVIARLGRPNGLDGFIGIYIDDEDLVHLQPESTVHVGGKQFTVRAVRRGKKGHQIAFNEVTSREGAEAIRGSEVSVLKRRSLSEREYWPEDLIGLTVRPGGGVVAAVNHGPAQDRLVIERGGYTFEVPFVDELVPVVDLDEGFVEVVEIEGLS